MEGKVRTAQFGGKLVDLFKVPARSVCRPELGKDRVKGHARLRAEAAGRGPGSLNQLKSPGCRV
jgi:hypothetical protein